MSTRVRIRYALVALLAAGLPLIALGACMENNVQAQAPADIETVLTVEDPPAVAVGDHPTVSAILTTMSGAPVADVGIDFWLDDVREGRVRTDRDGLASFEIRRDLDSATYEVSAVFGGVPTSRLQPSRASATLTVVPALLTIQTVPRLQGVHITLAPVAAGTQCPVEDATAQTFVTGEDGAVIMGAEQAGTYCVEVLDPKDAAGGVREVPESGDSWAQVRAEFSRWGDSVFTRSHLVDFSSKSRLEVGFDVFYLVRPTFVEEQSKRPVDPERIEEVTIASPLGVRTTRDPEAAAWLQGYRVVRRSFGLEASKIQHSVEKVVIDGTNVVNRAQQRFFPASWAVNRGEWRIELLLYAASFRARDAIFGFPIGSAINLKYPDGHTERHGFGDGAELRLESMPRGEYEVSVDGPGFSFTRPVTLTRDQIEVRLEVISYLDIFVAIVVIVSVTFGLLFVGRPHLLSALRARMRSRSPSPAGGGYRRCRLTDPRDAVGVAHIEIVEPEPLGLVRRYDGRYAP